MTTDAKWSDFASLDGTKTAAAASQLLPAWVSLALVVLIGWQLAKLAWALVPSPEADGQVTITAPDSGGPSTSSILSDVNRIAAAHIFGIADAEDIEVVEVVEDHQDLRETRTSLSLKGTLAATPAEDAIAIIADTGTEEKIYGVGQVIQSGVRLHAVYLDRVVLNENGVLTSLELPKEFPESAPAPVRRNNTQVTRTTAAPTQTLQNVVAQNVTKLSEVIRPTPYFVGGQQQGYRVYPGRNRAQFSALGLRPGDLIKSIDGQSLNDPQQAMQIFQSLGNADSVSVTVERNGQPEVLTLSTSQLDLGDDTDQ